MLSALIRSGLSYPAVLLAEQPADQGSVQHGPLVLVSDPRGLRSKASGQLVPLGYDVAAFTPAAYRRGSLPRPLKDI